MMETLEMDENLIKQFQGGAVTVDEIVNVFNPSNAATMPEAFLQFMPYLTGEQIAALANAYPNKATGNSYLILMDTAKKENQLYPRSTWQNLFNLRKVGGTAAKGMVALTFTSRFQERKPTNLTTAPVQDISSKEGLPGLKVSPVQQVEQKAAAGAATGTNGAGAAGGPMEQQGAGQQGTEGAANAIGAGSAASDFPELTIEEIQQAQKGEAGEAGKKDETGETGEGTGTEAKKDEGTGSTETLDGTKQSLETSGDAAGAATGTEGAASTSSAPATLTTPAAPVSPGKAANTGKAKTGTGTTSGK